MVFIAFWGVELLQNKCKEVKCLPKKDDFDVATLSRIKVFLGPWPRALEAAELKEPKIVLTSKKRKKSGSDKNQRINALRKVEKNNRKNNTNNNQK